MEHRGASSADNISGDGSGETVAHGSETFRTYMFGRYTSGAHAEFIKILGILSGIPWKLFAPYVDPTKVSNKDGSTGCAVGMVFLPK